MLCKPTFKLTNLHSFPRFCTFTSTRTFVQNKIMNNQKSSFQYVKKAERNPTEKSKASNSAQKSQKGFSESEASLFMKNISVPFVDSHMHLDMFLKQMNKPMTSLQTFIEDELPKTFHGCIQVCCFQDSFPATEGIHANKANNNNSENKPSWNDNIFVTYGFHPHAAKDYNDEWEQRIIKNLTENPKAVAWGECGLDFFKSMSPHDVQKEVFARQLTMAKSLNKPLVIHSRDAEEDTYQIMTSIIPADYPIHLHCFTGSTEFLKQMLEYYPNLCVGITGAVTFPSAQKNRDTAKHIPLDRLLLETDGPFMAPPPFRGTPAHPGMIPLVAKTIGELHNVSVEEVLTQTLKNAHKVYKCFPVQ